MAYEGELQLIVGGMFAGKSTELKRRGKRYQISGKKVLYVKPKRDTRYSSEMIYTHDGDFVGALVIESIWELQDKIMDGHDLNDVDVVLIDEIQFFDEQATKTVVRWLLREEVIVIASGLDMDRDGRPFGAVPYLMAIAEHVTKLKAVCVDCGKDAWISHGTFESSEQIELGAQEKYVPLCRSCDRIRRRDKNECN